ncbi:MAG: DUF1844 domain-containing protein [Desulfobacteraceae bacterium]
METEEKGFVIRDKRSFDDSGELKKEEAEVASGRAQSEQRAEPSEKDRGERPPLPEVSFSTLIMSLSSSALFHLGEIPDPQTGKKAKDLPLAKHTIDTIGMLREKTEGNLSEEEQKFVDSMLADLRMRFVKATG